MRQSSNENRQKNLGGELKPHGPAGHLSPCKGPRGVKGIHQAERKRSLRGKGRVAEIAPSCGHSPHPVAYRIELTFDEPEGRGGRDMHLGPSRRDFGGPGRALQLASRVVGWKWAKGSGETVTRNEAALRNSGGLKNYNQSDDSYKNSRTTKRKGNTMILPAAQPSKPRDSEGENL